MTLFDVVTVSCFAGLVICFFTVTDQNPRLLLRFLLATVALAFANQIGNRGYALAAAALIAAAITFVATQISKKT